MLCDVQIVRTSIASVYLHLHGFLYLINSVCDCCKFCLNGEYYLIDGVAVQNVKLPDIYLCVYKYVPICLT